MHAPWKRLSGPFLLNLLLLFLGGIAALVAGVNHGSSVLIGIGCVALVVAAKFTIYWLRSRDKD
jgi:hypothetical protein